MPARSASNSSVSTKSQFSKVATRLPTVDLPEPDRPVRKMRCIMQKSSLQPKFSACMLALHRPPTSLWSFQNDSYYTGDGENNKAQKSEKNWPSTSIECSIKICYACPQDDFTGSRARWERARAKKNEDAWERKPFAIRAARRSSQPRATSSAAKAIMGRACRISPVQRASAPD